MIHMQLGFIQITSFILVGLKRARSNSYHFIAGQNFFLLINIIS